MHEEQFTGRILVFAAATGDRYRAGRTVRALKRSGLVAEDVCALSGKVLADRMAGSAEPL